MVRFTLVALALSSLAVSFHDATAQRIPATPTNHNRRHARRVLKKNDNISEKIKEEKSKGAKAAKLTVLAEIEEGEGAGFDLDMDVVEATPSVDENTLFELEDMGGTPQKPKTLSQILEGASLADILVTDPSSPNADGTFAVLAVDLDNDEMHGFVEKSGSKPYKLSQKKGSKGGKTLAEEETDPAALTREPWACGVSESFDDESTERRLYHDFEDDHHGHSHHDHHHDHSHGDDLGDDPLAAIDNLSRKLRGSGGSITKIGEPRRLAIDWENDGGDFDHQVDLYIEVDNSFVSKTGNTLASTANYINLLVSSASVIYEKEIRTHLRVTKVVLTTRYDATTSTSNALNRMISDFQASSWESTHPDAVPGSIDLHHALLGKSLGGGIAYVGVVCSSSWGYGLTANMSGNFNALTRTMMWDISAFMHEVGHNFGSGHTHDAGDYSPVIDTCGNTCPSGSATQWSTIMSYCHLCSGGDNNIYYSFGGSWSGSGSKTDINNWIEEPVLTANANGARTSVNPKRCSNKMYNHVASPTRSTCTAISVTQGPTPAPTPGVPTPPPSPKPTVVQSPVIMAAYDSSLGAPKCSASGGGCDSGPDLLKSHGGMPSPVELNPPNTLDSCNDGANGSYQVDESVESIKVVSVTGGPIQPGVEMKIEAKVFAWSTSADTADFWYAANANSPVWVLIASVKPTASSAFNTLSANYVLPEGSLQAVRVVLRYGGSAVPCPTSGWDDIDDLAFVVGGGGGNPPPTSNPTNAPTSVPTSVPTNPPTNPPTTPPTNKPTTRAPTSKPTTRAPTIKPTTRAPTSVPTNAPTIAPTNAPTSAPTNAPTNAPNNSATNAPTDAPTNAPTSAPTVPTGGGGVQFAVPHPLGAPACETIGNRCDSGDYLKGSSSTKGPELNHPNTLSTCVDGSAGVYYQDESIEKIVVRAGDIGDDFSTANLEAGNKATIIATVYAYSGYTSDFADFYYAADASNPNWIELGTVQPTAAGINDLKISYTLPPGGFQAVRVNFRYGGSRSPCTSGSYDDHDDLAFAVQSVEEPVGSGTKLALYDGALGAPSCSQYSSQCTTDNIVIGRGTMSNGVEPNHSNTLDACVDGNYGGFHGDESIDKVVVRAGEIDGSGSNTDFMEGGRATIIATVWAWSSGSSDRADFFYAGDATNPVWQFIGTIIPSGGGEQVLAISYTLPQGSNQAVRVSFRYGGVNPGSAACTCKCGSSSGNYDDADDIAFFVKPPYYPAEAGAMMVAEAAVKPLDPNDPKTIEQMAQAETPVVEQKEEELEEDESEDESEDEEDESEDEEDESEDGKKKKKKGGKAGKE